MPCAEDSGRGHQTPAASCAAKESGETGMTRDQRAQRREFIRSHHPDHGGDTETFRIGLDSLDHPIPPWLQTPPRVIVIRSRPWPLRLITGFGRHLTRKPSPSRVR
jgi:hypothetical protein